MQVVIFELGEEKYAIETSGVQGIDKMMDITMVPCAPLYIKGLVNLRGNIITVYDPHIILGNNSINKNSENILIIETENELLGIMVDKVTEIVDIDSSMIKNISASKEDDRMYIKGTLNIEDYIITLIDVTALLNAA